MAQKYYYELDYRYTCEVCGEEIRGVARRGPIEAPADFLPSAVSTLMNLADAAISKKMLEDDIAEGNYNAHFVFTNANHCPHCGVRQAWYPMAEPKAPGLGIGTVVICGFIGAVVFMLISLFVMIFAESFWVFPAGIALGAVLGVLFGIWVNKSTKEDIIKQYEKEKQEYEAYIKGLPHPNTGAPEIDWKSARARLVD